MTIKEHEELTELSFPLTLVINCALGKYGTKGDIVVIKSFKELYAHGYFNVDFETNKYPYDKLLTALDKTKANAISEMGSHCDGTWHGENGASKNYRLVKVKVTVISLLLIALFSCTKPTPASPSSPGPASSGDSVRIQLTFTKAAGDSIAWSVALYGGAGAGNWSGETKTAMVLKYNVVPNSQLSEVDAGSYSKPDSAICQIWVNGVSVLHSAKTSIQLFPAQFYFKD